MTVRTRFAPSPTGYLHVGGARTALYSWLYARHHQGQFILRIEDTDLERSTPEAVQAIFDGMSWLNLPADEGPYFQTQRFDRYKAVAAQLLAADQAYRCYCSKERLDNLREQQLAAKEKPRYDGHCRHLTDSNPLQPHVIRFKNPLTGEVVVDDQVHGRVVFQNSELDDLIIARSDGSPTYNFTVVVDDWDMQITHVIRGDDHLNNTPRQINILKALGAIPPVYAHIPMILGQDGKKLSKRHGAVSVMQYRDQGFLPEALLNYLIRLGWSHGDQEIFSREEMISYFDIKAVNKSAAAFDVDKLTWLNQHYLKTLAPADIAEHLSWQMQHLGIDYTQGPSLVAVVELLRERVKTLQELAQKSRCFYEAINLSQLDAATLAVLTPELVPILTDLQQRLAAIKVWQEASIDEVLHTIVNAFGIKLGKLAPAVRVAVCGSTVSPPITATLGIMGQATVVERLAQAITYLQTSR